MHGKKALFLAILISITAFSAILVFSLFRHLKRVEADFTSTKAKLIKENMNLKDQYGILEEDVKKKAEELTLLAEENENLKKEFTTRIEAIEEENVSLAKKVTELEEMSLVDRLREALDREENEKVKKFLEKVLYNIVLIQSGRSIELEPIVVAKEEKAPSAPEKEKKEEPAKISEPSVAPGKKGNIVSVDRKYSLVVIDLGRKDGVSEDDTCLILKDGKEVASAKIISVRYKIAAAFVGEMQQKYNIRNVKEGDEVIIPE